MTNSFSLRKKNKTYVLVLEMEKYHHLTGSVLGGILEGYPMINGCGASIYSL